MRPDSEVVDELRACAGRTRQPRGGADGRETLSQRYDEHNDTFRSYHPPLSFVPSFLPSFRLHGAAGSGGDAISATGPFSAMGHSRQMAQPQISGDAQFEFLYS